MPGERQSERLKDKEPIDYSDTRRIHSPNKYSALAQDNKSIEEELIDFFREEEEEEEEEEEGGEEDEDEDNWCLIDTMPEETKTATDINLDLSEEELRPINEPELHHVIEFGRLLANKLVSVGKERHPPGGYAHLVETPAAYQERLGSAFVTVPPPRKEPKVPQPDDYTKVVDYQAACLAYKGTKNKYTEELAVGLATKKAIQKKFPLLTLCFRSSRYGCLPADKSPREILKILADHTVSDDSERDRLAIELTQQMKDLPYTPNMMGPIAYLREMRDLRILTNDVKGKDEVPESRLMNYAVMAFEDSGHDKTQISRIINEWVDKKATLNLQDDLMEQFEIFWCQKLKNLHRLEFGGPTAKHRANLVNHDDLQTVHKRIDEDVLDRTYELQAMQAQITALETQLAARKDVPSAVTAPTVSTHTPPAAADDESRMAAMVASAIAALQANSMVGPTATSNTTPNPNSNPNPRRDKWAGRQIEWRKVDKWCWSCGANTSHNSATCRTSKPARDHPNATKDKPEGGNSSKDGNWGKYFHPKRGYKDTKPSN